MLVLPLSARAGRRRLSSPGDEPEPAPVFVDVLPVRGVAVRRLTVPPGADACSVAAAESPCRREHLLYVLRGALDVQDLRDGICLRLDERQLLWLDGPHLLRNLGPGDLRVLDLVDEEGLSS